MGKEDGIRVNVRSTATIELNEWGVEQLKGLLELARRCVDARVGGRQRAENLQGYLAASLDFDDEQMQELRVALSAFDFH